MLPFLLFVFIKGSEWCDRCALYFGQMKSSLESVKGKGNFFSCLEFENFRMLLQKQTSVVVQ